MSLTPTLCSMLRDPLLLQDRYVRYIERAIDLARSELERTRHDSRLQELARMYLGAGSSPAGTCLWMDGGGILWKPFAQLQDHHGSLWKLSPALRRTDSCR